MPFQVGERLDFKVYFEFILGGTARMEIVGIEQIDGFPCYRIVSTATSTRTVDLFYKVRDKIESWRDIEGGFSRMYNKHLRERKYAADKNVHYQPEKSRAFLRRGKKAEPETLQVDGQIHDVLEAFYAVRTYKLEVGNSVYLDLHDIDKRYQLEIKVHRRERIEVPAGEFDCFVIEPLLQSSGIFRKEGDLQIWVTDDEYRMPVLMKSKLYFGSVWAKLVDYKRGR